MRRIALDAHASAPPISLLASPELAIYELLIHRQPRRNPREHGNQGLAMRLAGRRKAQHANILDDGQIS
jgi:hypothetical protein